MVNTAKITGIVLAGGQSKRMGSDKGLIPLFGKPLLSYSIAVLENICNEILIGANHDNYKSFGFPVVPDEIKEIGPVGGILSGLKASGTQHNFILSCDMPLVSTALVNHIIENKGEADIAIPMYNGYPEPLCGYYSKAIIPQLGEKVASGMYKLQDLFKDFNTKYLEIGQKHEWFHPHLFENVNSQADLERIGDLMEKSSGQ